MTHNIGLMLAIVFALIWTVLTAIIAVGTILGLAFWIALLF